MVASEIMNTAAIRSAYVLATVSNTICPNAAISGSMAAPLRSNPAPTPAAKNIIAKNNSPLPMNTVEKNLSS